MKKLFSLILALCMACMMIPAVAEEGVAGEWYASLGGMTMVLNLAEDGTAEMTMLLPVPGFSTVKRLPSPSKTLPPKAPTPMAPSRWVMKI